MNMAYDLVIIGGGSAGLTAAGFAVKLGARVALVERERLGGDCTWTGCVPSKTLLKAARVAHEMGTADRFGLSSASPVVDLKQVMAHVRKVVEQVYQQESSEVLRAQGIDVFLDNARFLDAHTLAVGDATITTRRVLLATGAKPLIPPVDGLDRVDYLTYQNIWDMATLPHHLMVLGAGPIGCEMAQAFRRLGARVTLVDSAPRILSRDDIETSEVLAERFEEEGVELRLNTPVERARQDGEGIHLHASGGELVGDALLVASSRRPRVDGLDLDRAGVGYSQEGIHADDNLRTSQNHIYAAGDCLGGYQFTHYAVWQGFMAVRNALLPGSSKGVTDQVPWTTFTDPEVAHIGLTEAQAIEKFEDSVMTCTWPM